jgi:hypothetical protein
MSVLAVIPVGYIVSSVERPTVQQVGASNSAYRRCSSIYLLHAQSKEKSWQPVVITGRDISLSFTGGTDIEAQATNAVLTKVSLIVKLTRHLMAKLTNSW